MHETVVQERKRHLSFSCDFNLIYSELLTLYTQYTKEKELENNYKQLHLL